MAAGLQFSSSFFEMEGEVGKKRRLSVKERKDLKRQRKHEIAAMTVHSAAGSGKSSSTSTATPTTHPAASGASGSRAGSGRCGAALDPGCGGASGGSGKKAKKTVKKLPNKAKQQAGAAKAAAASKQESAVPVSAAAKAALESIADGTAKGTLSDRLNAAHRHHDKALAAAWKGSLSKRERMPFFSPLVSMLTFLLIEMLSFLCTSGRWYASGQKRTHSHASCGCGHP